MAHVIALGFAKLGMFLGLGMACLRAGKLACATEALTLEILRHPTLLTNIPIAQFLEPLFGSPIFFPALEPYQTELRCHILRE